MTEPQASFGWPTVAALLALTTIAAVAARAATAASWRTARQTAR